MPLCNQTTFLHTYSVWGYISFTLMEINVTLMSVIEIVLPFYIFFVDSSKIDVIIQIISIINSIDYLPHLLAMLNF